MIPRIQQPTSKTLLLPIIMTVWLGLLPPFSLSLCTNHKHFHTVSIKINNFEVGDTIKQGQAKNYLLFWKATEDIQENRSEINIFLKEFKSSINWL